jgi:glycine/D-amino acid oxidase-like deaminating enzyme
MTNASQKPNWGETPWAIDFRPARRELPVEADFAVIGGGFTGLAAAAWLREIAPERSVVLLERGRIGAGASGRTGGLALAETAAGDLPGLGDVLAGYADTLRALAVYGDLQLPGVWELARRKPLPHSPISWNDSGELRATAEVPGGTINPGKVVSGLASAAEKRGAMIFENASVDEVRFEEPPRMVVAGREIRAKKVLFACNAQSLEMSGMAGREPKLTLAAATAPLTEAQIAELGLASGKPFYTVELPYVWGRLIDGGRIIFGAGLVHVRNWRELHSIDVTSGEPAEMFSRFEQRVRKFHPVLRDVRFTHRWGGPILMGANWGFTPVFKRHPQSRDAIVLGSYSGHGVALSVYLGRWAAEALLGRRELPDWKDA